MKRSYWLYKMCLLLGLGICIPVTGNASDIGDATLIQQQSKITASGVVVDESGESLIGASVMEKGAATNGTITDIDGRFSLSVAPNAILEISYVGYQKQDVPAKKDMRIIMHPDVANLEEVVVVAYGTQKKVSVIGSVASIDRKELMKSSSPNLSSALSGNRIVQPAPSRPFCILHLSLASLFSLLIFVRRHFVFCQSIRVSQREKFASHLGAFSFGNSIKFRHAAELCGVAPIPKTHAAADSNASRRDLYADYSSSSSDSSSSSAKSASAAWSSGASRASSCSCARA